jgi:hypothetical protein
LLTKVIGPAVILAVLATGIFGSAALTTAFAQSGNSPQLQTCPDGSQPDSNGNCPTQQQTQQQQQQQLPNQLQQPGINNQFPQPNQNPFQQQQPQQGQQFLPPPTATYPPSTNQHQPPAAQFGPPQYSLPQQLFNPQFVVQCLDRVLNDSIMNGNNSTGYIANQTKLLNSCIGR